MSFRVPTNDDDTEVKLLFTSVIDAESWLSARANEDDTETKLLATAVLAAAADAELLLTTTAIPATALLVMEREDDSVTSPAANEADASNPACAACTKLADKIESPNEILADNI